MRERDRYRFIPNSNDYEGILRKMGMVPTRQRSGHRLGRSVIHRKSATIRKRNRSHYLRTVFMGLATG